MLQPPDFVIPLDDAHEILSVFGIGPNSRAYRRWRRDDGFRLVDFLDVLNESPAILGMDWRGWLKEVVDNICEQLQRHGISATAELDEQGNEGFLHVGTREANLKYVPADEDDFDAVVENVNSLVGPIVRYRKFRSCEGTDGWSYAILSNEDWGNLQSAVPATMDFLFKDLLRA